MNTFPYIILLKSKLCVIELPEKPTIKPPMHPHDVAWPDYNNQWKAYESARSAAIENRIEVDCPNVAVSNGAKRFSLPDRVIELKEGEEVRWPGTWEKKKQSRLKPEHRIADMDHDWEESHTWQGDKTFLEHREVARLIAPEQKPPGEEEEKYIELDKQMWEPSQKVTDHEVMIINGIEYIRKDVCVTIMEKYKHEPVSSDTQSKLWRELIDIYDVTDRSSEGYGSLIKVLSKQFTITRKS